MLVRDDLVEQDFDRSSNTFLDHRHMKTQLQSLVYLAITSCVAMVAMAIVAHETLLQ